MSTEQKGYKILLGTTTQWESSTTVPAKGQICINTDDQSIRVGDGIKSYAGLSPLTTEYEVRTFFADFGLNYIPEISTIQRVSPEGAVIQEITLTNLNDLYNTYGDTTSGGARLIKGPVEVITENGGVPLTVHGPAVFDGDVTIQGTTTTSNTQNLQVEDNLITVAKGNAGALTAPAGLHVQHYDGTNDGALVFDNNGIAYVGDVVLDNGGNIKTRESNLQPLATRTGLNEQSNGHLIKWDNTNNTLVDSEKTVDDFVPKIKNEQQNFKCYVERGFTDGRSETMTIQATTGDFSTSIIQRDANGRAKINTPTTDLDGKYIVNKQYVEDNFVPKTTTAWRVYATNGQGNQGLLNYTAELGGNALIQRDSSGRAKVQTPTDAMQIANKKYVDDGFVAKRTTTTTGRLYLYAFDETGQKDTFADVGINEYTVARRTANGRLQVGAPSDDADATTKAYVDNLNTITITAGA